MNDSVKEIGWCEWVSLPELGIEKIKVKVDTGAKTSALHVSHVSLEKVGKKQYVTFKIHPLQRSHTPEIVGRARLLEYRNVKSSVGNTTLRPVIETQIKIGNETHTIEVTLVNRDMMGFRMLLGRQAMKQRYLVNPSRTFMTRKKKKKKSVKGRI